MTHLAYQVLHILGAICLFLGLATALMPETTADRKIGLSFHGIGLLLLLVAGFGIIAKLKLEFEWWIIVKLVLWLGFGAMPIIGKRGLIPPKLAWSIAILCGLIAIVLGKTHGRIDALFS